jgi:hypothetical protein
MIKRLLLILVLVLPLYAQAVPHKIVLTWPPSATPGITGYNVKRFTGSCVAPGLTWTVLTNTTLLTYTDSTVAGDGVTYCYVITAVTVDGESDYSSMSEFVTPIYRLSKKPLPPGVPVTSTVQ